MESTHEKGKKKKKIKLQDEVFRGKIYMLKFFGQG